MTKVTGMFLGDDADDGDQYARYIALTELASHDCGRRFTRPHAIRERLADHSHELRLVAGQEPAGSQRGTTGDKVTIGHTANQGDRSGQHEALEVGIGRVENRRPGTPAGGGWQVADASRPLNSWKAADVIE